VSTYISVKVMVETLDDLDTQLSAPDIDLELGAPYISATVREL